MSDTTTAPVRIVILGVTGDLARRYLVPALSRLDGAGRLASGLSIVGIGRADMDTGALREQLRQALVERDEAGDDKVLERISYHRADVDDAAGISAALDVDGPVVVYLALPPSLFTTAVRSVRDAGLPPGSRIVVEKPFGDGLDSAKQLNALLHDACPEEAVFRIDHFLHRQTVQNVLGLRFANRVFEPLWNRNHVERIDIRWDEQIGLEGRAGYYDEAGALRDMVQNHLLQLACLVGMEPPATMSERDLRDRKVEFLRAVRRYPVQEVAERSVRARYTAGRVGDRDLPAYVDEEGVDPGRQTETFAELTLEVDNPRWAGVPFVLRSGKALGRDRRELVIHYRPVSHLAFGQGFDPVPNRLCLQVEPDRVALHLNVNGPGDPFDLEPLVLDASLAPEELSAYARLLLDVFAGDPILSIRDDEAEESWRIVEPVLDAWASGMVPLREYPAGSDGPAESRLAEDAS